MEFQHILTFIPKDECQKVVICTQKIIKKEEVKVKLVIPKNNKQRIKNQYPS